MATSITEARPKRQPRIIKTNDRISVMYKRRDNNLGLIAPDI
jgi:hypothetical protein